MVLESALLVLAFLLGSTSAVAGQISVPHITAHNCRFLISFQQPEVNREHVFLSCIEKIRFRLKVLSTLA